MTFPSPWNPSPNEWTCAECGCFNDRAAHACWNCSATMDVAEDEDEG